jgi:hypothetical protein
MFLLFFPYGNGTLKIISKSVYTAILTMIEVRMIFSIEPAFVTFIRRNRKINDANKNGSLGNRKNVKTASIATPVTIFLASADL